MSLVALRTSRSGPRRARAAPRGRAPPRDLTAFLPTTREEMTRARLGRARRPHRHRRRLRRPPRVRARPHRPLPRGARATASASSRSRAGPRPTTSRAWGGRASSSASARATSTRCSTSSPRRRRCASEDQYSPGGRTEHAPEPRDASSTRTSAGRRSPGCPSCSAASRRRSGASPTTTTGATQVRRSILLDARPTCSSSAWASAPRGRSRGGSTPASASSSSPTSAGRRT